MPIQRTIKYAMTPLPVTMTLWNSAEMAKAMGIPSGKKLIEMIQSGRFGIVYHMREPIYKGRVNRGKGLRQVGWEYFFQESCYKDNIELAKRKG